MGEAQLHPGIMRRIMMVRVPSGRMRVIRRYHFGRTLQRRSDANPA